MDNRDKMRRAVAALRKMEERIRQTPTSSGGEMIFHDDGSMTENRWTATAPKR